MSNTVLITGISSGIGKVTADYFKKQGWNVIGTSRTANGNVYQLDVTDPVQCQQAVDRIITEHGSIDVLVNNAGYGLFGAFEQCSVADVERQYRVNVFGTMHMCRSILPHFRKAGRGTIVNIASMGGRLTVPYYGVYNSTKFAVEGFSEGLWHELLPFGIRVKVIEPGVIKTDFYDRSKQAGSQMEIDPQYKQMSDKLWPQYAAAGSKGAQPVAVAKVIYKAATSWSKRLHYGAARDAHINMALMKVLPHQIGLWLVRQYTVNR